MVQVAPRRSSSRKWAFRLIAAGVPLAIGAVVIVAILIGQQRLVIDTDGQGIRFQPPPIYLQEPGHELTGHKYLYDSVLGWRNIPSWKATTFGRPLTINSNGLRGRERPFAKAAGTKRMVILGDSYAWGYGVADDEVFPDVLERRLQRGHAHWEVLNTGVSGWGTDQEYLFLTREGFRYAPDLVVLAFFLGNDPDNNICSMQYALPKPYFGSVDMELLNVPVPPPGAEAPERCVYPNGLDGIELTLAIVEAMNRECKKRHCRLVIMKFGAFLYTRERHSQDVVDFMGEMNRVFHALVGERLPDTPYLDLDRQFTERGISAKRLLEGNDDGHWNAFGHKVTAEALHEFLVEADLLQ